MAGVCLWCININVTHNIWHIINWRTHHIMHLSSPSTAQKSANKPCYCSLRHINLYVNLLQQWYFWQNGEPNSTAHIPADWCLVALVTAASWLHTTLSSDTQNSSDVLGWIAMPSSTRLCCLSLLSLATLFSVSSQRRDRLWNSSRAFAAAALLSRPE